MDSYTRTIPGNFNTDEDNENVDEFTANVLRNFATEGVTAEGKPNK